MSVYRFIFERFIYYLMRHVSFWLFVLLSVLTGGVFLYSAYTKFYPIQSFEYTMTEFVHLPAMVAAIAARFLVGLEAALGALIALQLYGRNKWALKAAFGLVAALSVYLVWLWMTAGNNVNCGCFGDAIWMSPSASLVKNGLLLVVLGLLLRYHQGLSMQWARVSGYVVFICLVALPYVLFPLHSRYQLDFKPLYTSDTTAAPAVDLAKGKHIIAFLSPSCIHCRRAALKMHLMKTENPSIPFYMVIGGTTSDLADFWKASNAQDIPHSRLAEKPFIKYTGGIFPTILWVNNGTVEANTNYTDLNRKVIEKWMK